MSLVSFHNESSFASFNFIHVGCQKPSNRFCFIYLTNFISVMGFILQTLKFIPYGHISSVSSKHPYSHPFYVKYNFTHTQILLHIVIKSFRFCPCGHFCYPCLKFHLCRQFYPNTWILWIPISHTGVSSHIIQYAHSGNQALALEHIVRYHQAFVHPQSVSGCRKIIYYIFHKNREISGLTMKKKQQG
jgi:hypothetical protein